MHRTLRLPLLPILALACSQPPTSSVVEPAGPAIVRPVAAPASAASPEAEEPAMIPREKFTDGRRNFEAARKALLESYYDPALTEDDLYRAAVAGMLERADPKMSAWNRLMSPTEIGELRSDLQGELIGIGVKIWFNPATGYIDVKGTAAGSPAERAGLAPPDKIVTVDGRLYKGLGLGEVVADIRGKAGETVTLKVLRGDTFVTVPVVRTKIAFDQVVGTMLPEGVGLVRIPSFNARTPGMLHDVLTDLSAHGLRALVVDLRENAGGSFDDAVASAGEMVPAGSAVVQLKKRGSTESVIPKTTPVVADVPFAVLVDHDTASSAELVTAALQELRHATVVGSHTKGKWTVQNVDDLSNGYAIKYTIGVFTSPGGRSFEGTGLVPDVEVDQAEDVRDHVRMEKDLVKRVADDAPLHTAIALVDRPH